MLSFLPKLLRRVVTLFAGRSQFPPVFAEGADPLPEIRSAQDLGPYWDAIVGQTRLLEFPRAEASLHLLRAVQTIQTAGTDTGLASSLKTQWARQAQDRLRYLMYEIFARCPSGGALRPSTLEEFKLGDATYQAYGALTVLRDVIETAKKGISTVSIDQGERLVTFENTADATKDVCRREETLQLLRQRSSNLTQEDFAEARARLVETRATVVVESAKRSFSYAVSEPAATALAELDRKIQPLEMPTEPLPASWSFGAYTIGQYRKVWTHLRALATLHEVLFSEIRANGSVLFNSSIRVISARELVDHLSLLTRQSTTVCEAIVLDLTFDPEGVPWTDVAYQPLIPLDQHYLLLVPALIQSSNFERNLLALVERLPHRKKHASRVKNQREGLMLAQIQASATAVGFQNRPRLLLRDDEGNAAGDIDVLLWAHQGSWAVAVQLKWLYGPDSVHETFVHAQQYREGADKHLRLVDLLSKNLEAVAERFGLTGLDVSTQVKSVMVTKDDEPLAGAVPKELPVVPLERFLELIRKSNGNAKVLWDYASQFSERIPDIDVIFTHRDILAGTYTFRVPIPTVGEGVASGPSQVAP